MTPGARSRRAPSRLAFTCGVGLVVTACSLVTELDGFVGGARDARGGPGDATPLEAGASDAPPVDDAKATPFCSRRAAASFCDAFDRAETLGPWDRIELDKAVVDVEPTTRDGGTGSELVVRVPANASPSGGIRGALSRRFATASRVRLEFSISLQRPENGSAFQVMQIYRSLGGDSFVSVYLQAKPDGTFLTSQQEGAGGGFEERMVPALSYVAWHDVVVTFDLAARKLSLAVDGASIVDSSVALDATPGETYVLAGVNYAGLPTGAFVARIDDVAVTVAP